MKEFLDQLLSSLNQIEVKGKSNMDILLGCIMAVEKAIGQINASAKDKEEEDNG